MSVIGWLMAVVGLIGVIIGLVQRSKAGKLAAAPFRRPSEIAQMGPSAADPKGMISTEGAVNLGPQPLYAPMSGEPCVAYEVTIERKWEKVSYGENGASTSTGKDSLMTDFRGATFQLGDGAGGVMVDASKRPDATFETSHTSHMPVGMMIPGALQFGRMQINTPMITGDGMTKEFVGTEKIIRPTPNLFVLGQLTAGPMGPTIVTPAGIGTGKLLMSPKGRDALLGSTARNAKLGLGIGGGLLVLGVILGLVLPGPSGGGGSWGCSFTNAGSCSGNVSSATGNRYTWTVTQPGLYTLRLRARPGVRYPMDPVLDIAQNNVVIAHNDDDPTGLTGNASMISQMFAPGTYELRVRTFGGARPPRGGYSFELEVTGTPMASGAAALPSGATMDPNAAAALGSAMAAAGSAAAAASAAAPGGFQMPPGAPVARSPICARVMRCCLAANANVPGGGQHCYQFATHQDIVCNANLPANRMLVQRLNPGAIAACD